MDDFDFSTLNPGQELRNYLMTLIPKEPYKAGTEKTNSFVDRVDYILREDGEYHKLIYLSTINFLLRKIIKSTHYYKKKSELVDDYDYIEQTRKYLGEILSFGEDEVEKILSLAIIIVTYYEKKPSSGAKNDLIRTAKAAGTPCYMCGKAINYDDKKSFEFVEVEHVWPKGMGGSNKEFNLKAACKICNKFKEEFIDYTDFHFEQISYKTVLEDHPIHEEFKYAHKLAIWGKNDYKCIICNRNAVIAGPLKFKRNNPEDAWHFLNIDAYCDEHYNI